MLISFEVHLTHKDWVFFQLLKNNGAFLLNYL